MRFIITTHKQSIIYDHDTDARTPIKRPTNGINWAYGASWHKDKLFIAWREPHEIIEYDVNIQPTGRSIQDIRNVHRLGDMHQITCYDGKIWVANTGYNMVSIFDAETLELIEDWNLSKDYLDDEPKYPPNGSYYQHFNSVMFHKDRLYVMAHMTIHNPPRRVWEFTYPEKKLIKKIKGGKQGHNIFFLDDTLTICDSDHARLMQPESGKIIFKEQRGAWLRGVSMPPNLLIVGRSDKVKDRANRNNGFGGLIFFKDRKLTHPQVHWLGEGPVEEVRCLDYPDDAHPQPPFWEKDVKYV